MTTLFYIGFSGAFLAGCLIVESVLDMFIW